MKELIERLEKATGPNRELDYAIRDFLFPATVTDAELPRDFGFIRGAPDRGHAREYTASLDAAMTLVPKDYSWHAYQHPRRGEVEPEPRAYADVYLLDDKTTEKDGRLDRRVLDGPHDGEAPTVTLALCIAALKALHPRTEAEGKP